MTLRQTGPLDQDPTPDFEAECVAVLNGWRAGDLPFTEAIARLTAISQQATASGHRANQGRVEHLLGNLQHYRGNLNISNMHYDRARGFFELVGNRLRTATMDLNQGENYRNKGDFNRALRYYRTAYEAASELGDVRLQSITIVNEGLTLISQGKFDEARAALLEGLELGNRWETNLETLPAMQCEIHHGLVAVYLNENQVKNAWEHAKLAMDTARQTGQPMQSGYANRAMGEALSALEESPNGGYSSDPDEFFRTAIEAFREINAEGELARTMLAHARSLAGRGRRTTAARKLQQAMIIFTRLGMTDDAAQAAEAQLQVI